MGMGVGANHPLLKKFFFYVLFFVCLLVFVLSKHLLCLTIYSNKFLAKLGENLMFLKFNGQKCFAILHLFLPFLRILCRHSYVKRKRLLFIMDILVFILDNMDKEKPSLYIGTKLYF